MQEPLNSPTEGFPEAPAPQRLELLPDNPAHSRLEKQARKVGTIAGQVVARVRNARSSIQPKENLRNLRETAVDKKDQILQQASARVGEWRQMLRDRSAHLGRRARSRYGETRERAEKMGYDYPWRVLAGAGVAGFIIGSALRIRRSSRAI
jgi:ElaB/YqjD/DUF883 family membrane-anchored ribosome-binding protein